MLLRHGQAQVGGVLRPWTTGEGGKVAMGVVPVTATMDRMHCRLTKKTQRFCRLMRPLSSWRTAHDARRRVRVSTDPLHSNAAVLARTASHLAIRSPWVST